MRASLSTASTAINGRRCVPLRERKIILGWGSSARRCPCRCTLQLYDYASPTSSPTYNAMYTPCNVSFT